MTDITIEEHKIKRGESFRVCVNKNLSAGGTLTLHVSNPANSGKDIVISRVKVTSPGPFTMRHPCGADYTAGTEAFIGNRRHGDGEPSSVVTAYQDSTWSNANNVIEEYIGKDDSQPGSSDNSLGGQTSDPVGIVVEGGDYLIEVENRSGSTAYDASIRIDFYESAT
jgi:hypothetical protein